MTWYFNHKLALTFLSVFLQPLFLRKFDIMCKKN